MWNHLPENGYSWTVVMQEQAESFSTLLGVSPLCLVQHELDAVIFGSVHFPNFG